MTDPHHAEITIISHDQHGNETGRAHAEFTSSGARSNPAEEVLLWANKSAGDERVRIISQD